MTNISHYLFCALLIATVHLHAADDQIELSVYQLREAIYRGDCARAMQLINQGVVLNHGYTPLHYAAAYSHNKSVLQNFINLGTYTNAKNTRGETPLHCAALFGRSLVARMLILGGAEVNAQDINNKTPLHCAAECGDFKTVETLLGWGANPEAKTLDNKTPIDLAQAWNREEVAKYIGDYNIPVTKGVMMDDLG